MSADYGYVFPAIRGVQAGREYYASMCPLRLLPKIFLFDEEELVPELRAQRTLNKGRLPEMARYVSEHPSSYVFSAITASIDGDVRFDPLGDKKEADLGLLHISMKARFLINDGQHRRAAVELALRERPELGDESISVVFFRDIGLERSQQMFADLNRYAVRPSRSLGVLYDYRDERAQLTRAVVSRVPIFRDTVEMERSTLSARSRRLFTLSAIYTANKSLLAGLEAEDPAAFASEYWSECARYFREWELVRTREMTAAEVRRDFLHSHGIALQALGKAGNQLIQRRQAGWKKSLAKLKQIDWSRSNAATWEGRALIGGRVSKACRNVTLTTNVIKQQLDLPLDSDEERVEQAFERGQREREEGQAA